MEGDTLCRYCGVTLCKPSQARKAFDSVPAWDTIYYKVAGFGACNPEGPSHWIFQHFSGLPGPNGIISTGKPGNIGYHATAYESARCGFVPSKYVKDLEIQYADVPVMRDRYLRGLWVEAEGLVYPGWKRESHILSRHARRYDGSELLTPHLPMYEWVDPGMTAPTAIGWVVVENCDCGCGRENFYLVEESYLAGHPAIHAAAMKQKRGQLPYALQATFIDSQSLSRTQMGQKGTPREDSLYSVAAEYGDQGIYCIANQKDWNVGYHRILDVLSTDPLHRHPVTGEAGAPHWYILSHCEHFQLEGELYKWKKARNTTTFSEEPVDKNDHHMDAWNGFLASRPAGGARVVGEQKRNDDDWEIDDGHERTLSHMAL